MSRPLPPPLICFLGAWNIRQTLPAKAIGKPASQILGVLP